MVLGKKKGRILLKMPSTKALRPLPKCLLNLQMLNIQKTVVDLYWLSSVDHNTSLKGSCPSKMDP